MNLGFLVIFLALLLSINKVGILGLFKPRPLDISKKIERIYIASLEALYKAIYLAL